MNICVIHRYPISLVLSTNPSFNLFLDKLILAGHKVFFVSFREENPKFLRKDIYHYQIKLNFNRANSKDKLFKSIVFTFIIPFIVNRLNKQNKIDLVYADDSLPFYGYLIKKITKLKTYIRLGDLQTAYFFWGKSLFKRILFNIIFSIERYTWKKNDRLITISNAFRDFIIENGIAKEKVNVVKECIDLDMFDAPMDAYFVRKQYNIGNTPLVLFHGLVAKMKGLDILIKAIPEVIKEIPDAKFMIVGDGPELTSLKNLSRKLKIEENIIFTGWVSFDRIQQYIACADICLPLRSSNLGNNFVVTTALLQYWAMKKSVVAPRLQAFEGVIIESKNGYLFNLDDHKDLAKKIISSLKNIDSLNNIGIAGYNMAKENFDIKLISENMAKVLLKS